MVAAQIRLLRRKLAETGDDSFVETVHGMGYRFNPGTNNKNSLFLGITTLYDVSPKLQLGGEIFHESPNTEGGADSAGFNLGGSFNLFHDHNILFSVGKGLKNASSTNQLSAYMALQVLY